MFSLYLDNFRGFKNTFIPISDVNFLVGENSTGKSTFLSVLYLLCDENFWYTQNFTKENYPYRSFEDIVSVNSEDKTYFKFGLIKTSSQTDSKVRYRNATGGIRNDSFLMTFKNESGNPFLSQFCFFSDFNQVKIKLSKKTVKYKAEEVTNHEILFNESNLLDVFNKWNSIKDETGYKFLKGSFEKSVAPLLFIIHWIVDRENKLSIKSPSRSFFDFSRIFPELIWFAPIRSKPKRTYDGNITNYSPEGDHTPYLIRDFAKKKKTKEMLNHFMEKFGKDSGLFDSLAVKQYGKNLMDPFELRIIYNNNDLSISNVGYGVSQSLPLIVELFKNRTNSTFAIQQPEVHLHPKAQAAFGEIIFNFATNENNKFFIETHSDFIIDRFRYLIKKNKQEKKFSAQVIFFNRDENGNHAHSIPILENGDYADDQPIAFREFFIDEELKHLGWK